MMTTLAMNHMNGMPGSAMVRSPQADRTLANGGPPPVFVPSGWKRQLVDGRIVYFSPTDCLIWSLNDAVRYLMTDGTCKCGLECPFLVQDLFNFDPTALLQIHSTIQDEQQSTSPTCCLHKKRLRHSYQQSNEALYRKQMMVEERHFRQQQHHSNSRHQDMMQNKRHYGQQQEMISGQPSDRHPYNPFPVNYSNHSNYQERHQDVLNGVSAEMFHPNHVHPGPGISYQFQEQMRHQPFPHPQQHGHHPHDGHPVEKRIPQHHHHDVTAVTASITDVIPSVGQVVPVGHHHTHHPGHNIQPPPAHQQHGHLPRHHVSPQHHSPVQQHHHNHPGNHGQQQVHYSVMPAQQQIVLMPPSEQVLLSPQMVSSFSHSSLDHPHQQIAHHPHQYQHPFQSNQEGFMMQQQHQTHGHRSHHQLILPASTPPAVEVIDRKRTRKRNGQYDRNKKGKTVAAILNLSM